MMPNWDGTPLGKKRKPFKVSRPVRQKLAELVEKYSEVKLQETWVNDNARNPAVDNKSMIDGTLMLRIRRDEFESRARELCHMIRKEVV